MYAARSNTGPADLEARFAAPTRASQSRAQAISEAARAALARSTAGGPPPRSGSTSSRGSCGGIHRAPTPVDRPRSRDALPARIAASSSASASFCRSSINPPAAAACRSSRSDTPLSDVPYCGAATSRTRSNSAAARNAVSGSGRVAVPRAAAVRTPSPERDLDDVYSLATYSRVASALIVAPPLDPPQRFQPTDRQLAFECAPQPPTNVPRQPTAVKELAAAPSAQALRQRLSTYHERRRAQQPPLQPDAHFADPHDLPALVSNIAALDCELSPASSVATLNEPPTGVTSAVAPDGSHNLRSRGTQPQQVITTARNPSPLLRRAHPQQRSVIERGAQVSSAAGRSISPHATALQNALTRLLDNPSTATSSRDVTEHRRQGYPSHPDQNRSLNASKNRRELLDDNESASAVPAEGSRVRAGFSVSYSTRNARSAAAPAVTVVNEGTQTSIPRAPDARAVDRYDLIASQERALTPREEEDASSFGRARSRSAHNSLTHCSPAPQQQSSAWLPRPLLHRGGIDVKRTMPVHSDARDHPQQRASMSSQRRSESPRESSSSVAPSSAWGSPLAVAPQPTARSASAILAASPPQSIATWSPLALSQTQLEVTSGGRPIAAVGYATGTSPTPLEAVANSVTPQRSALELGPQVVANPAADALARVTAPASVRFPQRSSSPAGSLWTAPSSRAPSTRTTAGFPVRPHVVSSAATSSEPSSVSPAATLRSLSLASVSRAAVVSAAALAKRRQSESSSSQEQPPVDVSAQRSRSLSPREETALERARDRSESARRMREAQSGAPGSRAALVLGERHRQRTAELAARAAEHMRRELEDTIVAAVAAAEGSRDLRSVAAPRRALSPRAAAKSPSPGSAHVASTRSSSPRQQRQTSPRVGIAPAAATLMPQRPARELPTSGPATSGLNMSVSIAAGLPTSSATVTVCDSPVDSPSPRAEADESATALVPSGAPRAVVPDVSPIAAAEPSPVAAPVLPDSSLPRNQSVPRHRLTSPIRCASSGAAPAATELRSREQPAIASPASITAPPSESSFADSTLNVVVPAARLHAPMVGSLWLRNPLLAPVAVTSPASTTAGCDASPRPCEPTAMPVPPSSMSPSSPSPNAARFMPPPTLSHAAQIGSLPPLSPTWASDSDVPPFAEEEVHSHQPSAPPATVKPPVIVAMINPSKRLHNPERAQALPTSAATLATDTASDMPSPLLALRERLQRLLAQQHPSPPAPSPYGASIAAPPALSPSQSPPDHAPLRACSVSPTSVGCETVASASPELPRDSTPPPPPSASASPCGYVDPPPPPSGETSPSPSNECSPSLLPPPPPSISREQTATVSPTPSPPRPSERALFAERNPDAAAASPVVAPSPPASRRVMDVAAAEAASLERPFRATGGAAASSVPSPPPPEISAARNKTTSLVPELVHPSPPVSRMVQPPCDDDSSARSSAAAIVPAVGAETLREIVQRLETMEGAWRAASPSQPRGYSAAGVTEHAAPADGSAARVRGASAGSAAASAFAAVHSASKWLSVSLSPSLTSSLGSPSPVLRAPFCSPAGARTSEQGGEHSAAALDQCSAARQRSWNGPDQWRTAVASSSLPRAVRPIGSLSTEDPLFVESPRAPTGRPAAAPQPWRLAGAARGGCVVVASPLRSFGLAKPVASFFAAAISDAANRASPHVKAAAVIDAVPARRLFSIEASPGDAARNSHPMGVVMPRMEAGPLDDDTVSVASPSVARESPEVHGARGHAFASSLPSDDIETSPSGHVDASAPEMSELPMISAVNHFSVEPSLSPVGSASVSDGGSSPHAVAASADAVVAAPSAAVTPDQSRAGSAESKRALFAASESEASAAAACPATVVEAGVLAKAEYELHRVGGLSITAGAARVMTTPLGEAAATARELRDFMRTTSSSRHRRSGSTGSTGSGSFKFQWDREAL